MTLVLLRIAFVFNRLNAISHYLFWRILNHKKISHELVRSGRSQIYYQQSGQGPYVILLHGGYLQLESFAAQIPVLSKHFTVIAIDTRGHGRSSLGVRNLSYQVLINDVIAVLKHLDINKAHFIGWSDGANTCLELALCHPTYVDRLVLISANYHPNGIKPDANIEQSNSMVRFVLRRLYQLFSPHPDRWPILDSQLQTLWQHEPRHTLETLIHIKAHTLILGGEFDLISEEHFTGMARAMPNATLTIIQQAGHDPHLSHAKQVNYLLLDFLLDPMMSHF